MAKTKFVNAPAQELLQVSKFLRDVLDNEELKFVTFPKLANCRKDQLATTKSLYLNTLNEIINFNEHQLSQGKIEGVYNRQLSHFYNHEVNSKSITPFRMGRSTGLNPYSMGRDEISLLCDLIIQSINNHGTKKLISKNVVTAIKNWTISDITDRFDRKDSDLEYNVSLIWFFFLSSDTRRSLRRSFKPTPKTIQVPKLLLDRIEMGVLEGHLLSITDSISKLEDNETNEISISANSYKQLKDHANKFGISNVNDYIRLISVFKS
ncbi:MULTISPECIES: hypothetical protein [Vibrio]|uniref:hypothetical protein n=1 Tax=Vibrio TaxID=662 RepID=UPI001E40BB53|nr:hypothetical protein [Vibrio lentus]MCC4838019.1 hypothetical protein [Vibrio lentus]